MERYLLLLTFSLYSAGMFACSCFGPQTFCETLDPPYPEPAWWIPDAVILGVKISQQDHGMDVVVIQTLSGPTLPGDTLRVWGDCGLLCRVYPGAWQIGDTVVWALKYTDLMGNGFCGNELEQEGEFMISICGTYYLNYENGIVTGPIAEGVNELPYSELLQYISTCGATSIPEMLGETGIETYLASDQLHLLLTGFGNGLAEYRIYDAHGRSLAAGPATADRIAIPIHSFAIGVYLVQVTDGRHTEIRRVLVP